MAMTPSEVPQVEALQFESPRDAALFHAVRADAGARGQALGARQQQGNYVVERWCSPEVPAEQCASGAMAPQRTWGAAWVDLRTYCNRSKLPAVFGLNVRTAELRGELGVTATVSLRGRGVAGDHWTLTWLLPDGTERLVLSDRMSWKLAAAEVRTAPAAGPEAVEADIAALVASPESFAALAHARVEALRAEVTRVLDSGEAYRCEPDMSAYKADGRPPPCPRIPLTAEEVGTWREKAKAHFAAQDALVDAETEALHALAARVLPPSIWARSLSGIGLPADQSGKGGG